MEAWLEWARGPAFVFALAFMLLGLARHLVLTGWEISRAMYRAGDKTIPYRQVISATLKWLFPVEKLKDRLVFMDFLTDKEENVYPMIPAGGGQNEMILV